MVYALDLFLSVRPATKNISDGRPWQQNRRTAIWLSQP